MEKTIEPAFVPASFIVPRKDSENPFYAFETKHKKYIILYYYIIIAITDYLPLFFFVRFFDAMIVAKKAEIEVLNDSYCCLFFISMLLPVLVPLLDKSQGPVYIQRTFRNISQR